MRMPSQAANTFASATVLRSIGAGKRTGGTLLGCHRFSPHPADQLAAACAASPSHRSAYAPWLLAAGARLRYSTQSHLGQGNSAPSGGSVRDHLGPGPATGAGTGVLISAQMFGAEVKGNPTESEADVAADRSDDDPLPPELHHTIRLPAGDAAPRPTESEEDVAADRGPGDNDPLSAVKKAVSPR